MWNNIFIEGLQGTGKSTLLNMLAQKFPAYHVYREGDISPVELAWCSYMSETDFADTLDKYSDLKEEIMSRSIREKDHYITSYTQILAERREFYEYMESYEIYNGRVDFQTFHSTIMRRYEAFSQEENIFECSFFQNSIESMMLFYQIKEKEIVEFYREAYEILKPKGFHLLYLDSLQIRENILQIKKERSDENGNEMWYPLMLGYLKESPYGKAHGYQGLEDMIAHFERRRNLECRIIREVLEDHVTVLPAKGFDVEEVVRGLSAFIKP